MASYQQLETELKVLKDQVDFLMRSIPLKVAHALAPQAVRVMPALEVYRMVKGLGADIQEPVQQEASSILGPAGEQIFTEKS